MKRLIAISIILATIFVGISNAYAQHSAMLPRSQSSSKPVTMQASIHKTTRPGNGSTFDVASIVNSYHSKSISIKRVLKSFYNVSGPRIIAPDSLLSTHLSITFKTNRNVGNKRFTKAFQQVLQVALGVSIKKEKRKVNVYVLKALDGANKKLKINNFKSDGPKDYKRAIWFKGGLSTFASSIADYVGRPVVDKTKLGEKKYSRAIFFRSSKKESIMSSVKKKLGLQLVPKKKRVNMLIIARNPTGH